MERRRERLLAKEGAETRLREEQRVGVHAMQEGCDERAERRTRHPIADLGEHRLCGYEPPPERCVEPAGAIVEMIAAIEEGDPVSCIDEPQLEIYCLGAPYM